nr:hypothetical protein [Tanacetum cinerariifolium]
KSSKDLENIIESQRPSPTVPSTSSEDQNNDTSTFEEFLHHSSANSWQLLAVGTPSTGSGNLYCQWKLSLGSGNAFFFIIAVQTPGSGISILLAVGTLSWKSRGLSNPCSSGVLYNGVVSVWVTVGMGIGAVGKDGSGIEEVVWCDDVASGEGV